MEVAIHLPDDVAASVPWEDVPRHILEQIALEAAAIRGLIDLLPVRAQLQATTFHSSPAPLCRGACP
jgi:hypothetical protein